MCDGQRESSELVQEADGSQTERNRQDRCSISVVIPLYNKADHIERAIRSVLAQTLGPNEVIVVDDASTDGGAALVEKFRSEKIQIVRRDSPGPGGYAARNLAIRHATSDWIAFLDADDAWSDNHIANLWQAISSSGGGVTMVATRFSERYPGGVTKADVLTKKMGAVSPMRLDTEQFLTLWKRLAECPVWTSAIVARREDLLESGMFPERCRRGGDKDLWLRLALRGDTIVLPCDTAIYFKDATNMVTRLRHGNTRHCLCESVTEAFAQASPAVKTLLKDIRDIENFHYAILTSRFAVLDRRWWTDFQISRFPLQAIAMFFLSTRLGHASFNLVDRLRKTLSKPAQ